MNHHLFDKLSIEIRQRCHGMSPKQLREMATLLKSDAVTLEISKRRHKKEKAKA